MIAVLYILHVTNDISIVIFSLFIIISALVMPLFGVLEKTIIYYIVTIMIYSPVNTFFTSSNTYSNRTEQGKHKIVHIVTL